MKTNDALILLTLTIAVACKPSEPMERESSLEHQLALCVSLQDSIWQQNQFYVRDELAAAYVIC